MKLFEVVDQFENEPFTNKEEKRTYLFRKQAAKCDELIKFYVELNRKFPIRGFDESNLFDLSYFHSTNLGARNRPELFRDIQFPFPTQKELPPTKERYRLKSIFISKYNRMIKAKLQFQEAGGHYGEYRNVFEADEFENKPYMTDADEYKYLFRKQASKCHAIDLFIGHLARKYPDWWGAVGQEFWGNHPTLEWDVSPASSFATSSSENWLLPKLGSDVETKKIRQEFSAKYKAMRQAKIDFERTGVSYTKFFTH